MAWGRCSSSNWDIHIQLGHPYPTGTSTFKYRRNQIFCITIRIKKPWQTEMKAQAARGGCVAAIKLPRLVGSYQTPTFMHLDLSRATTTKPMNEGNMTEIDLDKDISASAAELGRRGGLASKRGAGLLRRILIAEGCFNDF